jgi:hypothetical protein
MAREEITGIVWRDEVIEWTTARKSRNRVEVLRSERLVVESPEPRGEGEDPVAPDATDVGRALKASWGKSQGPITFAIGSHNLLMRVVKLPEADDEEMREMVLLQLDKFCPFPVETMVVSHEILCATEGTCDVLVVAAQQDHFRSLESVVDECGMQPDRVDVDVLGWWSLLQGHDKVAAAGRQLILLKDDPSCALIAVENGIPLLFRSLGDAGELSAQDYADEIAHEIDYTLTSIEIEHGPADELRLAVWHWNEVPADIIDRVAGDERWTLSVETFGALPPLSEGVARRQLTNGQALLDLVPDAWRAAEDARAMRRRFIWSSAAVLVVWVLGVAALFGLVQVQNRRLAAREGQLEEVRVPAMQVRDMRRRVKALAPQFDDDIVALDCLRDVAAALPPSNIDLKSFGYGRGKVQIAGRADTATLVYSFKSSLDKIERFKVVTLAGLTKTQQGENFRMTLETDEESK